MKKKKKVYFIYRFEVLGIKLVDSFAWDGASVWGVTSRLTAVISTPHGESIFMGEVAHRSHWTLWSWPCSGRARKAFTPPDIRKPIHAGPNTAGTGVFSL